MTTATLSLEHLIRPSNITNGKAPVLFMFHGYGSNEEDLFSFAPELPKELCIISVRAPYAMQPFGNMWYTINFEADKGKWNDDAQAILSRDKIKVFIEEACNTYGLDETNVTLLGFSQGTILSYAVALTYPQIVKNVVALSGYISNTMLPENYRENDFKNLKVYASHGNMDQVIPVSWAQQVPETLTELGIDHIYEEFPVGHGVAPQNFHSFKKWLEDKI